MDDTAPLQYLTQLLGKARADETAGVFAMIVAHHGHTSDYQHITKDELIRTHGGDFKARDSPQ